LFDRRTSQAGSLYLSIHYTVLAPMALRQKYVRPAKPASTTI
jgi:hypothetical protein